MPLALVKSLPNSTSAFAGSQAAQHRVSCLPCAAAGLLPSTPRAAVASTADAAAFVHIDHVLMSASLLVNAPLVARHASAGDNAYTGNRPAEVMIGFEIRVPRIGLLAPCPVIAS